MDKVRVVLSYDDETVANAKREADRQHTTQNSIRKAAWWAFGAASLYAAIAAIQSCLMWQATIATKKSADAAAQSAEAIRPRLAIASLTPAPLTPNGFPMDGKRLRVSFQLPNYGPIGVANVSVCEFDDVEQPNRLTRLPYSNCQPSSAWTYGNPVVPPSTVMNGVSMPAGDMDGLKILSDSEIRSLEHGDLEEAVFSVLATYPDAAGKIHHAESCILFTFKRNWGTQSMGAITWGSKPCSWETQND